jgi:hypothetical protein
MIQQNLISFQELSRLNQYDISHCEWQDLFAKRNKNGLDEYIVQIGNRLFIDEDEFSTWFLKNDSRQKSKH